MGSLHTAVIIPNLDALMQTSGKFLGSCLKTGQHSISVIIKIIICIFVFCAVSQILFKMVMYLRWTIKIFYTHFDNTNGHFNIARPISTY